MWEKWWNSVIDIRSTSVDIAVTWWPITRKRVEFINEGFLWNVFKKTG
jgi:hypothetical protein